MTADKKSDVKRASRKTPAERRKTNPESPPTEAKPKEMGGPKGPEPTRYGDWERKGIASDF